MKYCYIKSTLKRRHKNAFVFRRFRYLFVISYIFEIYHSTCIVSKFLKYKGNYFGFKHRSNRTKHSKRLR